MQSEICKFNNGTKVFITGGSGFVGRVLIEKLLRSTNVSKIYMLLRPKNNKNIETRAEEIFNSVLFQKLKNGNFNFRNRIIPINGDCSIDDLGLSVKDRLEFERKCKYRVSQCSHCRGTKAVLTLCKEIKNLKSEIEANLKDLSLEKVEKLTRKFIERCRNTYTFTKALAEIPKYLY